MVSQVALQLDHHTEPAVVTYPERPAAVRRFHQSQTLKRWQWSFDKLE